MLSALTQLRTADLVVPNLEARALALDFETLVSLSENLSPSSPLAHLARTTANDIMNAFSVDDPASLRTCRDLAEKVLGRDWEAELGKARGKVGKDKDGSLWAIGHCHIDTACEWEVKGKRADGRAVDVGCDEEEDREVMVNVSLSVWKSISAE